MVVHDVCGVLNGFDRLTWCCSLLVLRDSYPDTRLYLVLNDVHVVLYGADDVPGFFHGPTSVFRD